MNTSEVWKKLYQEFRRLTQYYLLYKEIDPKGKSLEEALNKLANLISKNNRTETPLFQRCMAWLVYEKLETLEHSGQIVLKLISKRKY